VRFTARPGSGMPGVLRALVDQVEGQRLEGRQPLADALRGAQDFSSSMWRARNSAWPTTNSSIRTLPQITLKSTQRSVE